MVSAIKRWLGIDVLERENLTLAKALKAAHRRIAEQNTRVDTLDADMLRMMEIVRKHEVGLTAEAEKPKIIAKPAAPKRVNWRQAREALEKRSDSPEEE
jgi:hypothetical protein